MRHAAGSFVIDLALTACGGQGNESAESTTVAHPMTRQALAAMVPNKEDFPPEVRSLAPIDTTVDRGYVTNAKESAKTPDPTDSGTDLARLGRTGGYSNDVGSYTSVQTIAWVDASVDAFERDDQAQRFLDAQFSALREQEGTVDRFGRRTGSVEARSAPAGLEPATELEYTLVAGSDRMRVALVAFRVGRVVGWSEVARLDNLDPEPIADALAQTLRRRVETVGQ